MNLLVLVYFILNKNYRGENTGSQDQKQKEAALRDWPNTSSTLRGAAIFQAHNDKGPKAMSDGTRVS